VNEAGNQQLTPKRNAEGLILDKLLAVAESQRRIGLHKNGAIGVY